MAGVGPNSTQVNKFVRLYKAGWLVQEIAEECHWSKTTVSRHLKKRGIEVRRYRLGHMRLSLRVKEETRAWYREGISVEEIARRHGVTQITIYERLDKMGEPRNRSQTRPTCKHGHLWTPENTRMKGKVRLCRECQRLAQQRYRKAHRVS